MNNWQNTPVTRHHSPPNKQMNRTIYNSSVIKIVTGVILIGGIVFLVQWLSGFIPQRLDQNNDLFNLVIAIIQCILAVWCYILLYRFFEKRRIAELSRESFLHSVIPGFLTGIVLQSLIILVLYLAGGYVISNINPASFMIPSLTTAFTAGFVAEILFRGVLFRLVEERLGTPISIGIMMLLFILLHLGGTDHTILSLLAVSVQAGFLLSAAYVLTRNLWFPIFLHFSWDFANPGIFGALNPGNSIEKSLFTCQVTGPELLTGASMGPVNSIQSLMLCLFTGIIFLWLAWRRKNFIFPNWKKQKE